MSDRVRRAASSPTGRKVLAKHAAGVRTSADLGAKTFGLAWFYVMGIYAVILVLVWVVAVAVANLWVWLAAGLVTLAVLPPLLRELRRRGEVRRALGRG